MSIKSYNSTEAVELSLLESQVIDGGNGTCYYLFFLNLRRGKDEKNTFI